MRAKAAQREAAAAAKSRPAVAPPARNAETLAERRRKASERLAKAETRGRERAERAKRREDEKAAESARAEAARKAEASRWPGCMLTSTCTEPAAPKN